MNLIIEIGSNGFKGFYENIFSNSDEFIDCEIEDSEELQELTGIKDLQVCYDYYNFNDYKKAVCTEFIQLYHAAILEAIPQELKEKDFFTFELMDDLTVISPKYYNYTTDKCYNKVKTNILTLFYIKWYILKLEGVQSYLIDNHSSYNGFISFINNNIGYWKKTPATAYTEAEIIALFDMLLNLTDKNLIDNINLETYYTIDKYEYAGAFEVEYNGQYIKYDDFINQIETAGAAMEAAPAK